MAIDFTSMQSILTAYYDGRPLSRRTCELCKLIDTVNPYVSDFERALYNNSAYNILTYTGTPPQLTQKGSSYVVLKNFST